MLTQDLAAGGFWTASTFLAPLRDCARASDTDLVDEFDNIKQWAAQNHMVINLQKNKELVFR